MSEENETVTVSLDKNEEPETSITLAIEPKRIGRPSDKSRAHIAEVAAKYPLSPFEILMMIANGHTKDLGYESDVVILSTPKGVVEKEVCPLELRFAAAREAAQYLHPKLKSIELSGSEERPVRVHGEINLVDLVSKARGVG